MGCGFSQLKSSVLTIVGLSTTAKPLLTPPSLKWLALVRTNVPIVAYSRTLNWCLASFFVKTHEKIPNSERPSFTASSPFLSEVNLTIGGTILSMIKYVTSSPASSGFESILLRSGGISLSKKLFPPPSFYGLSTNLCGYSIASLITFWISSLV